MIFFLMKNEKSSHNIGNSILESLNEEDFLKKILEFVLKFNFFDESLCNSPLFYVLKSKSLSLQNCILTLKLLERIKNTSFRCIKESYIILSLIESFETQTNYEIKKELLNVIYTYLGENLQLSEILLQKPLFLKYFFKFTDEKIMKVEIFILKTLYSQNKNIQILNNLFGIEFLTKVVSLLLNEYYGEEISFVISQLTREFSLLKQISMELIDQIFIALKTKIAFLKEKEEFLHNILCFFSNLTYNIDNNWFFERKSLDYFVTDILNYQEMPRALKIRVILVNSCKFLF